MDRASKIDKFKKNLRGEIRSELATRIIYSTDASIFEILPQAVFYPHDEKDIINIVRFSMNEKIPLHPRGAGSGMAGQSLGEGIILDFTRHMNKILEFNQHESTITVLPGITQGKINGFLKPYNKFLPVDPSSGDYCTIGGMVANNSSGAHSLKYGSTKEFIKSVEFVTSQGNLVSSNSIDSFQKDLLPIFNRYSNEIAEERPKTVKNSSGYNVFDAFLYNKIDFNRILTGSEGTLAIFDKITLSVIDIPKNIETALLIFSSTDEAIYSVNQILETRPSVLELVDEKLLKLLSIEEQVTLIPSDAGALLLVEYIGKDENEEREKIELIERSWPKARVWFAKDPDERAKLWKIRKSAASILNRVHGTTRAVRLIEDLCVPVERLAEFYCRQKGIFDKYGIQSSFYGHIGSGNIHLDPHIDTERDDLKYIFKRVADESYDLVISLRGTISGEHGDGILRAPYLPLQYPKLHLLFCEIKKYFDPDSILNPGKKISDNSVWPENSIKFGRKRPKKHKLEDEFCEIEKCNGCGNCRIFCPIFKGVNYEDGAPRAKSNLLRGIIYNRIDFDNADEIKGVFDLCLNCKRCKSECPARVDIPNLVLKARREINNFISPSFIDKMYENTSMLGEIGSLMGSVTNYIAKNSVIRTLLHNLNLILQEQKIPEFKKFNPKTLERHYLSRIEQRCKRGKIAYFVSCSEKYNNPEQAYKSMLLLKKLGFELAVPDFSCCMLPKITYGSLEKVDKKMGKNFDIMKNYFEMGYKITTSETSCGLAIGMEYKELGIDNINISSHYYNFYKLIYDNLSTLAGSFKPIAKRILIHYPCHLVAQGISSEFKNVLAKIPELEIVDTVDLCCGMGGTFGLKMKNFDISQRAGSDLFARIKKNDVDLVVTACTICALQIEQQTKIKTTSGVDLIYDSIFN